MGHEAMVSQPVGDGLSHSRTAVPLTTGGSHQPAMHRTAPHRTAYKGRLAAAVTHCALHPLSPWPPYLTGLYAWLQHANCHSGQCTEGAASVGTLQRWVGFPLKCGTV
jgi:hypothetical protein